MFQIAFVFQEGWGKILGNKFFPFLEIYWVNPKNFPDRYEVVYFTAKIGRLGLVSRSLRFYFSFGLNSKNVLAVRKLTL